MIQLKFLERIDVSVWNEEISKTKEFPRHWKVKLDLLVELSDGREILIKKGTIWDGASIPKFLWWVFKPIDNGALGDLIHDELWVNKQSELEYFNYNIFEARKFADNERVKWRNSHAPNKKIKTKITNFVIRIIGGFFYSNQIKIPK